MLRPERTCRGLRYRPGLGVGRAGLGVRGRPNGPGIGGRWGYGRASAGVEATNVAMARLAVMNKAGAAHLIF
jgi:hypothetical protein